MTNIFQYRIRGFAALLVLLTLMFTSACEEDLDGTSGEPELLSFGPSGVKHGEEIIFIGTNFDQISSIEFRPEVMVTKEDFTAQTAGEIRLNVPAAAEAGHILLHTSDGDTIRSKSILNFEVPVNITGITPEARPGDNITISGDKVNWIESVTFTSEQVVEQAEFVSQSISELVVTVPMEAQSGFLIFSSGGTEPLTFGSEEQLTVTVPEVTALTPASIRHTANLSISGTDLDLITSAAFTADTVLAANFVSQSATEIVLPVPATTETGTITLMQRSPITVETSELTILLPVATATSPVPATPGVDNLTITGTDLDLVAELIFAGAGSVSSFVSQSETEIVVAVPEGATLGPISYVTIHGYEGGLGAVLVIPADGPPPLIVSLYEEGLSTGGEGGGWSSTTDFNSSENAREGSVSMKVTYTGDWGGGAQIGTWGQDPVSVSGTEVFAFSIFGTDGTDGQNIQVVVKDGTSEYSVQVPFAAGEWTDVEIPLEDLGNMTQFTELFFQNTDQWQGTVYIDRVGFSLAGGPPTLSVIMYDDASTDLVGQGGGWGGAATDWANTENVREGDNAIKATFAGGYGGAAQFGTWDQGAFSISGTSVFAFSVFGSDVAGVNLQVLIKDGSANEYTQQVAVTGGEWQDVEINLADLGSFDSVSEVFFQDTDWSGTVYIDYVGFR